MQARAAGLLQRRPTHQSPLPQQQQRPQQPPIRRATSAPPPSLPLAPPPRRRRLGRTPLAASAAASSESDEPSATATATATSASTASKTPWYSKNTEGWLTLETAGDLARAAHAARRSGRRVLALDLYAPSCSVCKSSWPALSRLARDPALSAEVVFAKASIDGDDARRLVREQQIKGIPWVLVLDVGEEGPSAPPPPPSEAAEAAGLVAQMLGQFFARKLGGGAGKAAAAAGAGAGAQQGAAGGASAGGEAGGEAGAAAAPPPPSVLAAAGASLVLGQGASFKKISVLRSNLAAVPALVKRGQKVVVDPNGLIVVA